VQGKRFTPRYKFRAQPFYTTQKLCDASCRRPQRTAGCADANPSSPESLSEQVYFRMSVSRVEIHAGGKVSVWRMRASSSEHLRHESSPSRVAVWDDDRSFLRDEQTRRRALLIETVRAVRMREEAVRCLSPQRAFFPPSEGPLGLPPRHVRRKDPSPPQHTTAQYSQCQGELR